MEEIYLYPHLGFGDAIILNGLIRHFCSINDSVVLFCKDRYHESIRWMLRDVKNLTYHQVSFNNGDAEIQQFIRSNNLDDKVIKLGFEELSKLCSKGIPFYDSFYMMHGFDPEFRFSNFYYERNIEFEEYVYNKLNPNNEKYVFIIDDSDHHLGKLEISKEAISKEYKIIKYDKKMNYNDSKFLMFNYYKILENAEEVHTLETAFFEFIRSIDIDKSKVNIHSYLRNYISSPIEGYKFLGI
jgi:hypothetical protein